MNRKTGLLGRTYRHINRYREILTVLAKHGFGDLLTKVNLDKLLPRKKRKGMPPYSTWERIRMALEELGPTFIKLGQVMSNRPDLLPQELIIELEKLQDAVPPFPNNKARELVETELGNSVDELFLKFSPEPTASASIAQIHKAVLRSGKIVIVKVQRPLIEKILETDLEIMGHLASLMEKHIKGFDTINPTRIVNEFERAIRKEIDFTNEANNMERFTANFKNVPDICVPKVFREFCSTRILTMEYIEGIKVTDLDKLTAAGNDPKVLARKGTNLLLQQIFDFGFFHADPHPGNIMVLPGNVICLLDFGMMGILAPKQREYLGNLIIGIVNQDSKKITKTIISFAHNKRIEHPEEFESQAYELIQYYGYMPLKTINIGDLLNDIIKLILKFRLELPSQFYLLSRALITIEGVARKLDPEFEMVTQLEPYAKKLIQERLNPLRLFKDAYATMFDLAGLLRDLPSETRDILDQVKSGRFKIEYEHKGLEPMLKKGDQISNRISFALVLASLVVGSSVIVLSQVPPKLFGIPIIGLLGFLGAGLMGFWLLISILRHGKM